MDIIYPEIPVESSSYFTASTAAGLLDIRAHNMFTLPWQYLKWAGYLCINKKYARRFSVERFISKVISKYSLISGKFNSIVIGPGSGGISHIGTALNSPTLPVQTMFFQIKSMHPDNVEGYAKYASELGREILKNNRNIEILIHQDPIHDRDIVKWLLLNRIKFKQLPETYKMFIKDRLEENGTVLFIYDSFPWYWYELDEDIWFQLGGYGDVTFEEYSRGSLRVREWMEKIGAKRTYGWSMDFKKKKREESEWGTPREFFDSAQDELESMGVNWVEIEVKHPSELGLLGTLMWIKRNEKDGKSYGYIVENFWVHSTSAAADSRYIPYWAPFSDIQSIKYCEEHLSKVVESYDIEKRAILGRAPAYGPDIGGISQWKEAMENIFEKVELKGHISDNIYFIKPNEAILANVGYIEEMYRWAKNINIRSKGQLSIDEVLETAKDAGLKVKGG